MPRQTRAGQNRAVEQRAQQRLAARKEAAKNGSTAFTTGGVETRRRNREAQKEAHAATQVAETRKVLDAEAAAKAEGQQPEVAKAQTKRPERARAQDRPAGDATLRSSDASSLRSRSRGAPARPGMATVALRGEQAERLRGLAAKHEMTLAKLLVRMMEVFEAQAG
jgi:hypothetical protein